MIPTALVAQKAREDVTVVLGGDGGDELFYGYPKYMWTNERITQYKKPYWMRKLFSPYFRFRGGYKDMLYSTQRDYADVYRSEGIFVYDFGGAELFDRIELSKMIPDRHLIRKERRELAYSDYDIKFFMNAVNQKVDRATMRSSLELRSPIMDYRVVEYSRLIPFEYLYTSEYGLKSILKDILFDIVPCSLLDRPKKGFTPSTSDWLNGDLKCEIFEIVRKDIIKDLLPELDADKIVNMLNAYYHGKNIDARMFWAIYSYVKWHNKFM
jgi:asparagine synthase (glutamine-hydrolysing)